MLCKTLTDERGYEVRVKACAAEGSTEHVFPISLLSAVGPVWKVKPYVEVSDAELIMKCVASSDCPAEVVWSKDGKVLKGGGRIEVSPLDLFSWLFMSRRR